MGKKVLLLSNMYPSTAHPSYGVFIKNFANNLESNQISYDKVVMFKSDTKTKKLYSYLIFFLKVFFTVLFKKYDVIYIHYPSITAIPVLMVSKFKELTVYTNIHGTDADPVTKKEKNLEKNTKRTIEISEKIIVPSLFFKDMIKKKYTIAEEKIVVYPSGGINTQIFYPQTKKSIQRTRNKLYGESNNIIIGFVSRIESPKGWVTFVESLNELNKQNKLSNIKAVIIGSGSEEIELTALIKDYQLSDYVIRENLVSQLELNDYFNSFDFFVFPTKKESLGLVALEAMATKTPVLGSNIAPLNDYIISGKNGFLFEKENYRELTRFIMEILELKTSDFIEMKERAFNTSQEYTKENCNVIFRSIFELD